MSIQFQREIFFFLQDKKQKKKKQISTYISPKLGESIRCQIWAVGLETAVPVSNPFMCLLFVANVTPNTKYPILCYSISIHTSKHIMELSKLNENCARKLHSLAADFGSESPNQLRRKSWSKF